MMEIIKQPAMGAIAAVLAVAAAAVTLTADLIGARARRPRSVDLAPGLYHFRDGKVEDGWLEWRPAEELFR